MISELQQVKFPVIVVVYVATGLANKGEYIGCLHGSIVGATDRSCKHSIRPRNCSEQKRSLGREVHKSKTQMRVIAASPLKSAER